MTTPIQTDSKPSPRVIIEEKQGCWPFRRVRKHHSSELSTLARNTLRPHPAYNDPVIVRSEGVENIAELSKQLEEGTFFAQKDIEEAKRIQEGNFNG
jgi:hypothetical protein